MDAKELSDINLFDVFGEMLINDIKSMGDFKTDHNKRPDSVTLEFDIEPLAVQSVRDRKSFV